MNRIILIGNGFDLAHGLPTSFGNFINHFWNGVNKEIESFSYGANYTSKEICIPKIPDSWEYKNGYEGFCKNFLKNFKPSRMNKSIGYEIKNTMLEMISNLNHEIGWVDIEQEYYNLLKKTKTMNPKGLSPDQLKGYSYEIDKINKDFSAIKDLFISYLNEIETNSDTLSKHTHSNTSTWIGKLLYSNLNYRDFTEEKKEKHIYHLYEKHSKLIDYSKHNTLEESEDDFLNLINKENVLKSIRKHIDENSENNILAPYPEDTLILNFNYTSTLNIYSQPSIFNSIAGKKPEIIHIHGSLDKKKNNPVIFGYGDELDSDYQQIEALNDDRYLENIKSIKYLETDNYKRLIQFIESNEYQVSIFGHSCGVSDRTLLNFLFEHSNCQSIKPYYFLKLDTKDNPIEDNYSSLVRNISRNFNDKLKMRDRVVNKTFCKAFSSTVIKM